MKLRFLLFYMLLAICPLKLFSQAYSYSWSDNKTTFLASTAFWAGSQLYERYRPFEIADDLNASRIWSPDSGAVNQSSGSADSWSDITLYTSMVTPAIGLLSDKLMGKEAGNISMMALQGFMMESGLTQFVKSFVERPRPFVYQSINTLTVQEWNKDASESFFSGHTSTSAYFTFFTAKVFSDMHPDSKWKPAVWAGAAILPGVTGYLRYKAGKHFPSDVITGYIVGASLGILTPEIYKNERLNLGMGGQGMQLTINF